MQLKSRRDFTLIEVLENTLALVPFDYRKELAIEFRSSEEKLRQNLEAIYTLATQRLLHLSYYLEWSRTIDKKKGLSPEPIEGDNFDYVLAAFHDFNDMKPNVLEFFNASFTSWINNQVVRELNEFLKFYLAELHETCTALKYTKKPITPSDIADIRKECKEFENGGMRERLAALRKNFDFEITHNREILSLYKVRNIFSHHDGIVIKKFCNKDGYLEVVWPQNKFRFKKRDKNEWVPYHKARKAFSSRNYESIQVTWLGNPEIKRYQPQEQIKLSYKDLNDLIFFYLFVFNELHAQLVDIVQGHGLKVKDFKEYMSTFNDFEFIPVGVPSNQEKKL